MRFLHTMPIKIHNKVLFALVVCATFTLFFLPFFTVAANRMVTPKGVFLNEAQLTAVFFSGYGGAAAVSAVALMCSPFVSRAHLRAIAVLCSVSVLMCVCGDVVMREADVRVSSLISIRVSFAVGFWLLMLLLWLMSVEAGRSLTVSIAHRSLLSLVVVLPLAVLMMTSERNVNLSLYKEYVANRAAFDAALFEHLKVVALTVGCALLIGLPAGMLAFRWARLRNGLFHVLNVIQTIPSIALFAFLLAPLAWLSSRFLWLSDAGVHGVGVTPAVIALTLYSLLPVVRATVVGLQGISPSVVEAARGMGMSRLQMMRQVQIRLALPVIVSGVRTMTVQAIGLTVVAALIGAGGFGAIMFRGLSGGSIDLVMLGVLPVLVLTMCVDACFKLISTRLEVGLP